MISQSKESILRTQKSLKIRAKKIKKRRYGRIKQRSIKCFNFCHNNYKNRKKQYNNNAQTKKSNKYL